MAKNQTPAEPAAEKTPEQTQKERNDQKLAVFTKITRALQPLPQEDRQAVIASVSGLIG